MEVLSVLWAQLLGGPGYAGRATIKGRHAEINAAQLMMSCVLQFSRWGYGKGGLKTSRASGR